MEKNYGLLFYLKKLKNYTTGMISIYMRITVMPQAKKYQLFANVSLTAVAANLFERAETKRAQNY